MFSISIVFGPNATAWRLLYKEEASFENAKTAVQNRAGAHLTLTDDFGQIASINGDEIIATMAEDMDASRLASIELMLHQFRTQKDAERRAQAEPGMRTATPVLTPMGLPNGVRPF